MIRLISGLVVLSCSLSLAGAAPRDNVPQFAGKTRSAIENQVLEPAAPAASGQSSDFVLTTKTEVHLDGQTCKYENVPANDKIVFLELAADEKTIVKIYFESRKS